MIVVFESLLPVFLLIALGQFLKILELVDQSVWRGLERISFYVLFPAFLSITMYQADFSSISFSALGLTFLVTIFLITTIGLLFKWPIQSLTGISNPSFSSIYQGMCRWNAFIALSIVEAYFGAQYLPVVILGIVTMMIPVNFMNILVVTWLGEKEGKKHSLARQLATNPLIISSLAGIALHFSGIVIYQPVQTSFELMARTTLPIGLILVGAGLQLRMPRASFSAALFCSFIKLLAIPALFVAIGIAFGVSPLELKILAVCGSVPSAMSGFLLARELGGDAPLYAGIISMQVIISLLTIPAVIHIVEAAL